ncbi:MAG: T9SS type A sorting domain-containing protein, partial [Bacteroidota bacterium]
HQKIAELQRNHYSVQKMFPTSIDDSNPLPITLSSFEGKTIDGENHLMWETSSELNNDFFEVQRSFDGINYEVIGEVKGSGTTEEVQRYSFVDELPFVGNNFYRLRQVDFDGESAIADKIVLLNVEAENNELSLFVYPNPTNQLNINTRVVGDQNTPIVVRMIDLYGKEVYNDVITLNNVRGDYKLKTLDALKQGVYILTMQQGNQSVQQKVVLTK